MAKFDPLVPALQVAELTTAGKGDEMLNIVINDSFSTTKSKKKKKGAKKGKGGKNDKKGGFTALEILQMKDAEKKEASKPQAKPVMLFKDFEKRFDDLLTKNKTPRVDGNMSSISPRGEDTHRSNQRSPRSAMPFEEVIAL